MAHYQIFAQSSSLEIFSSDSFSIVEEYPAFVIAESNDATISTIKNHYPIRRINQSPALPSIPVHAQLDRAFIKITRRGPYFMVIKLATILTDKRRMAFHKKGIQIITAIGSSSFVLFCTNKKQNEWMKKQKDIAFLGFFIPKIWFSEKKGSSSQTAQKAKMKQILDADIFIARFFRSRERNIAFRVLKRHKIPNLRCMGKHDLLIDLCSLAQTQKALRQIIQRRGLRSLGPQSILYPATANNHTRRIIGAQKVESSLGLTGKGEIFSIADTGLDTGDPKNIHADFAGRILSIKPFVPSSDGWGRLLENGHLHNGGEDIHSGHGTHVCGCIAGNGTLAEQAGLSSIKGTAPEARIVFLAIEVSAKWNKFGKRYWKNKGIRPPAYGNYGLPYSLKDLFTHAYKEKAKVHINSWGNQVENKDGKLEGGIYHHILCYDLDEFVWKHPDFLIVNAAGNESSQEGYTDEVAFGSMIAPGTAKNCITVGASENECDMEMPYGKFSKNFYNPPFRSKSMTQSFEDIAAFSGRGPCKIGRIKPDVVAPGTFILSTRSSLMDEKLGCHAPFTEAEEEYAYMTGTSFATPQVAGCALLIRQYLRKYKSNSNPSAALIKATLIHSCRYLKGAYRAEKSSYWMDNEQGWGRIDVSNVCREQHDPHIVLFYDEVIGLRSGEEKEFTFNLPDSSFPFRITLAYMDYPGEALINNLNLSLTPPDKVGYYTGNDPLEKKEMDNLNNVESIIIDQPLKGNWLMKVIATKVPEGPQPFALVVSGSELSQVSPNLP